MEITYENMEKKAVEQSEKIPVIMYEVEKVLYSYEVTAATAMSVLLCAFSKILYSKNCVLKVSGDKWIIEKNKKKPFVPKIIIK